MAAPLSFSVDISDILERYSNIAEELEAEVAREVEKLTIQAHAHVIELATAKLNSTKDLFIKNLDGPNQVDDHTWEIVIKKPAVWIEDGVPENFDMLPGLLASPKAKTNSKGERYIVVPFKHNRGPSQNSASQKILTDAVKSEMKKRDIPYGKIEKNPDGSPKLGLLHKFNTTKPDQKNTVNPPAQGPQGKPWQVNSRPQGQEGPGGRPYLWGLRVYQKEVEKADGSKGTQKDIMTFRTATQKHAGVKWIRPGSEGKNFLGDTLKWVEQEWEKVKIDIFKRFGIE